MQTGEGTNIYQVPTVTGVSRPHPVEPSQQPRKLRLFGHFPDEEMERCAPAPAPVHQTPASMLSEQKLCACKRGRTLWQQLPKGCCYFTGLFLLQMKVRRKWSDKEFLIRKDKEITTRSHQWHHLFLVFRMTKTKQNQDYVGFFFKDGRKLRWGCLGEFCSIPAITGSPLPCGWCRWRKSLAEKRKISDQVHNVSPVTLPGAWAQAKEVHGHTHAHRDVQRFRLLVSRSTGWGSTAWQGCWCKEVAEWRSLS